MNTVTNTSSVSASPEGDLSVIRDTLTKWLVGQPYLFSRAAYQNELTVHFGDRRPYSSPKMSGQTRGTHVLSVRASAWMLQSGTRPQMVSHGLVPLGSDGEPRAGQAINPAVLESGNFVAPGATVVRAEPLEVQGNTPSGIALTVRLTDGTLLTILPSATDPTETLSDWELLAPDGVLRVGPGSRFTVEGHG